MGYKLASPSQGAFWEQPARNMPTSIGTGIGILFHLSNACCQHFTPWLVQAAFCHGQKGGSDFCATPLHCKDRKFLWNTDCCSVKTTSGHPGGASSFSAAERDRKLLHIVHMAAEMAPIAKVRLRRHTWGFPMIAQNLECGPHMWCTFLGMHAYNSSGMLLSRTSRLALKEALMQVGGLGDVVTGLARACINRGHTSRSNAAIP